MRSHSICGLGGSVFTVLAGWACASALAQAPATAAGYTGERSQVIAQLHAAHKILVRADHDYDGHRARAAEEVHKAIRDLEADHHHHPSATPATRVSTATATVKPKHHREPQKCSDAQLAEAMKILEGVQGELSARHPRAAANVHAAIREIRISLKLK